MDELFWPKHLKRNQIQELLQKTSEFPLLLVIAPMGYGKTTMVRSFLDEKQNWRKFWIDLDRDEIDEVWVWRRICEKLKSEGIYLWEKLIELEFPKTKQQINNLVCLLKDAIVAPTYIIVDNFQECASSSISSLIEILTYEKIPDFHIIVISRTYPELPYDEMWMKGYCFLIEQGSLILSAEEIRNFFLDNGVELGKDQLEEINKSTEGWMAAVYLMLMYYKKNHRLGTLQSISHLMRTSIFDRLPEKIKELFMKVSILEKFSAEQASYILGTPITSEVLYSYAEKIGFIKYSNSTKLYQCHALFRLVSGVALEESGLDKVSLYQKCGIWYERRMDWINALQYYQKAGNTERIFKIVEKERCYILYEQAPVIIMKLFDELEENEKLEHEDAYLSYIYTLIVKDDLERGKHLFKEAKKYYLNKREGEAKDRVLGELALIEVFLSFNDLPLMTSLIKKSYELLKGRHSSVLDSGVIFTYGIPNTLILFYNKAGKMKEIVRLGKEYAYYHMRMINSIEGDLDKQFEAEYHYMLGNVAEAEKLAKQSYEKARLRKQSCVIISSYLVLMRCNIYLGKKEEFFLRTAEIEKLMEGEVSPLLRIEYDLAAGYLHCIMGESSKISQWIIEFELSKCSNVIRNVRGGCIIYGLYLISQKKWMALGTLAEEMFIPYGKTKHILVQIYSYIYQSIAAYHIDGIEKADAYLKEAILLAQQDDIVLLFAELSPYILPILRELEKELPYIRKILPHCENYKKGISAFFEPVGKAILTERESELMKLVIKGFKNAQIGNEMGIAMVTVEKMLTNIYRKLNVTGRTAAIAKIREENII